MIIAVSLAALFATLILGIKTKTNVGLTGSVFALVIGCFLLQMSPGQVFALFPVKIIFKILPITLFYGFALENGTLKLLVDKLLYKISRWTAALPVVVYVVCILMGISGIGAASIASIFAPIVMAIAAMTQLDTLCCCTALALGAAVGSSFVTSEGGATSLGIMEQVGYVDNALQYSMTSWIHMLIVFTLILTVVLLVEKKKRRRDVPNSEASREAPEPFNAIQRKTLALICVVVAFIVVPLFMNILFKTEFTDYLYRRLDIGFIMLAGALAASLMKLASLQEVIKRRIPWSTIFVVCGMTMLIGVAVQAGLAEAISSFVVRRIPKALVLPILAFSAAFLSCFCGAVSVVLPTFFPLVGVIAAQTGLPLGYLLSAVFVGASCTGISPFSTGGSVLLNCCTDEAERDRLMPKMLLVCAGNVAAVFLFYLILQWI